MRSDERRFITYRPILGYQPDISWLTQYISVGEANNYRPSSELADANSILATDLLQATDEVINNIEALMAGLESCLSSRSCGPTSFADYLKAKEAKDYTVVNAFESYHDSSVEGLIQAEMYTVLEDLLADATSCRDHIATTFFTGDTSDVAALRKKERTALNARFLTDIKEPEKTDHLALSIEAKLKQAAKDRVEAFQEFTMEVQGVLKANTASQFKGRISQAVSTMAAAPKRGLAGVKQMAELRLAGLSAEGRAVKSRLFLIGNQGMRGGQSVKVQKLRQLRLEQMRTIGPWLQEIAEADTEETYNALLRTATLAMADIDIALDDVILDIVKMNKLDKMNRSDMLANLAEKKAVRQVYHLADSIETHFNQEDPNKDRQVKRLIQNLALDKPGDLCTP